MLKSLLSKAKSLLLFIDFKLSKICLYLLFQRLFHPIGISVPSEQNCNLQYNSTGNKNVLIPRYIFVRLPGWRCFFSPSTHFAIYVASLYLIYSI